MSKMKKSVVEFGQCHLSVKGVVSVRVFAEKQTRADHDQTAGM